VFRPASAGADSDSDYHHGTIVMQAVPGVAGTPAAGIPAAAVAPGLSRRHLAGTDAAAEAELTTGMWRLLRAGAGQDAVALAAAYGQPWRAALLDGATRWNDDFEEPNDSGRDFSASPSDRAAEAHRRFFRRGNPFHALYRGASSLAGAAYAQLLAHATAQATAAETSAAGGGSAAELTALQHERALLAHAAGQAQALMSVRGAVRTWEDAAWVAVKAALQHAVEHHLAPLRAAQAAATARLPAASPSGAVASTLVRPGAGPRAVDAALQSISDCSARSDLQAMCDTAYVRIVRGLLLVAASAAPASPLPEPAEVAGSRTETALLNLLRIAWREVYSALPPSYGSAAEANAVGPGTAPEHAFSLSSADALGHEKPLHAAGAALARFCCGLCVFLREHSELMDVRLLSAQGDPGAAGRDATVAEARKLCEDIIYAYIRHLAAGSWPEPQHEDRSLRARVMIPLLRRLSPHRAARALVAYLVCLPYTPGDTLAGSAMNQMDNSGNTSQQDELALSSARRFVTSIMAEEAALGPELFINVLASAVRQAAAVMLSMSDAKLQAAGGHYSHLQPTAYNVPPALKSEYDAFDAAGLSLSPELPAKAIKLAGMNLIDYCRVTSVQWLQLLSSVEHESSPLDMVTASNALCRMLVERSLAQTNVLAAYDLQAMLFLLEGVRAGPNAPKALAANAKTPFKQNRAGSVAATPAASVIDSSFNEMSFRTAAPSTQLAEAELTAPFIQSSVIQQLHAEEAVHPRAAAAVREYEWWLAFLAAQQSFASWVALLRGPLSPSPVDPAGPDGRRPTTAPERDAFQHAVRLHKAMLATQHAALVEAASKCDGATAAALRAAAAWMAGATASNTTGVDAGAALLHEGDAAYDSLMGTADPPSASALAKRCADSLGCHLIAAFKASADWLGADPYAAQDYKLTIGGWRDRSASVAAGVGAAVMQSYSTHSYFGQGHAGTRR
jgi:hypothetical protein